MPGIPHLLIVPDLNILVSDPNIYQYAPDQLLLFFATVDLHNQAILARQNTHWCLSKSLLQQLLIEFPWRMSQQANQLTGPLNTVLTAYLPVLNRAITRNPDKMPAVIIPASFLGIRPHSPQTREEWLKLMASSETCWQEKKPSFDGMFVASRGNGVLEIYKPAPAQQLVCRIDVFEPNQWAGVYQWGIECLPRTGPYSYQPPRTHGGIINFPKSTTKKGQSGFLDANGNIWCWDLLHRDHWDVIDMAGNPVRRVRPDGRLFP